MDTKKRLGWQKVNIWRGGVCKVVDIRYRRSVTRVECYRDTSEQRPEKAKLELSTNDREVRG